MHLTLRSALLAAVALSAPSLCHAADITPEQARTLEGQLRGWFAGMAGPGLPVATSPIQVTPDGDHYRLTAPPAGVKMPVEGWPPVTLNARPADGGRWTLDGIKIQSPATFTVETKATKKAGEAAGAPTRTTYTFSYATQEGGGTWDPAFATPSVISSNATGFRMLAETDGAKTVTTMDRTASVMTLKPVAGDRVDFSLDGTGTGYAMQVMGGTGDAGGPGLQAGARQVKVQVAMPGVSRMRTTQIVPALVRMGRQADGTPNPGGKPNPEGVRLLIAALQGFASGMTLSEVLDDFSVKTSGIDVKMGQLRFAMDARADGGLLNGGMDIGMDALALGGMGLEGFADLLPRRVAMRPIVSNVPSKELLELLQAMSDDPDGKAPPAQVAAVFGKGGIKTGLESFAVDMGGATFTGKADVLVPNPNEASGTAQIVATNLDALMTKVQAIPALAQQGVPVIVFAKGIGRVEGGKIVWDVQFDQGKLLVNGVDLMKMAGK